MSVATLPDWAKGSGSGYGYGSGYGDGYGSGYGSGYGDGYGSGYGDGYGDGYGSGYGYGYGDGYGDGDGSLLYELFADHPNLKEATKDGSQVVLALWRSDKDGQPVNGGAKGEAVRPGLVQTTQGPLRVCTRNALHGDTDPSNWKGDRWWVVALKEPVQRQGTKIGSLTRIIIEELV